MQIRGIARRFDLSQTDVTGNNGQDVVQIVSDSSGERPERFQFARGQPLFFDALAIGHISQENRNTPSARICKQLKPDLAARVTRFKFDRHLFGHGAPIILFKGIAGELWKLYPKSLPISSWRRRSSSFSACRLTNVNFQSRSTAKNPSLVFSRMSVIFLTFSCNSARA